MGKIVRGKTRKTLPQQLPQINRKSELTLLGVTLNEDPNNWDTHFDMMLHKASSRLYILRVCKYFGYSMDDLTILFNSLIMSVFLYAIEVWACAYKDKYIKRIDKFCRRAVRFGYTENCISIFDIIEQRDKVMWNKIISNERHCLYDLLPEKRTRKLREREHDFILPKVHTERFKRCFINRCLFKLP